MHPDWLGLVEKTVVVALAFKSSESDQQEGSHDQCARQCQNQNEKANPAMR